MAPIKFEEHIKEQLEERRITPSDASWERLAGQLNVAQGRKKGNRLLWMSIAASFLIGVGLTAVFFNKSTPQERFVNAPAKKTEAIQESVKPESLEINKKVELTEQVAQQDKQKQMIPNVLPNKKSINANKPKPRRNISIPKTQNNSIAQNVEPQLNPVNPKDQIISKVTSTQGPAFKGVTANAPEKINPYDEVDVLLAKAQKNLSQEATLTTNTPVDATALLLEIEEQVNPERFRDKLFRTLKSEFSKAIEAVASKEN